LIIPSHTTNNCGAVCRHTTVPVSTTWCLI